jgi:hypothetical protein
VAIGATVLLGACSPGAEFPSVLDSPQPRADKPMSPDQVKEVTNSLISDRDHLSAGAQPAAQASAPAGRRAAASPPDATGSTQSAGVAARP